MQFQVTGLVRLESCRVIAVPNEHCGSDDIHPFVPSYVYTDLGKSKWAIPFAWEGWADLCTKTKNAPR